MNLFKYTFQLYKVEIAIILEKGMPKRKFLKLLKN